MIDYCFMELFIFFIALARSLEVNGERGYLWIIVGDKFLIQSCSRLNLFENKAVVLLLLYRAV